MGMSTDIKYQYDLKSGPSLIIPVQYQLVGTEVIPVSYQSRYPAYTSPKSYQY
jgi:hypothetical protein